MEELTKKKLSKIAFASALVLFILLDLLYLYNIFKWGDYPNFGFAFRTATGIEFVGFVNEHGQSSGMKANDRILKVNGKTVTSLEEFREAMHRKLGQTNTYLLEREGQQLQVSILNVKKGLKKSLNKSGLPYVVGLCYTLIGTLVFLMKPYYRASWIFFFFAAIFGLNFSFSFQSGVVTPLWLETFNIFTHCFTPAVLIHLTFSFPEERFFIKRYPYLQWSAYIVSAFIFICIRYSTPTLTDAPKIWLPFLDVYSYGAVLFFLGSCLQLWIRSTSEIVTRRAKIILLGSAISVSLPLLELVLTFVFHRYLVPSINYYLPFFIIFPIFVGYAIVKHDLFEFDTIIKRTYGYILTTGAIAGVYGLLVLISDVAFGKFEITKSPLFPLAFVLAVVFLFNPIRNRTQKFIDRVFYRLEYDYQDTVHKISETMRSLLKLDEIGKSIMDISLGTLFVDAGGVLLLNKGNQMYEYLTSAGEREFRTDWRRYRKNQSSRV